MSSAAAVGEIQMALGPEIVWLFGAALMAGAINAIAGGGGLLVFPALLFAGVAPLSANATSAAAIWIGMAFSSVAYRQELKLVQRQLIPVTLASLAGGGLGAWLLLRFSDEAFARVVPFLIAIATFLFAIAPQLIQLSKRYGSPYSKEQYDEQPKEQSVPMLNRPGLVIGQSLISIYGGFFGGGAGILMLTLLSLSAPGKIQTLQAIKVWMALCINAAALSYLAFADLISWPHVGLLAAGTSLGGYSSAKIVDKVPAVWLRRFVIFMGSVLTVYFWAVN